MRIGSVKISNFRAFRNVEVIFDNYCALVGPNGAGKSTVLSSLARSPSFINIHLKHAISQLY